MHSIADPAYSLLTPLTLPLPAARCSPRKALCCLPTSRLRLGKRVRKRKRPHRRPLQRPRPHPPLPPQVQVCLL
eukprot:5209816-Pleurochrysis_carterae.AAC.1